VSFDLVPDENAATMLRAANSPSPGPEPGFWTGFIPGAASLTMKGFAEAARGISLAGAVGPMIEDRLTGGTAAQDTYFQQHDDLFNTAVDYWTPAPGEVGTAGRIVGSLVPILAQAAVSPGLALNTVTMGTAEDLVRQGVDANKAVGAGVVQGTGLGLGMALPIFGNSWMMRALVGGAASNVAQGVVSRAVTAKILEGTKAAEQYDPWNAENIVLDTLMGVGFGSLAHVGAKHAEELQRIRDQLTDTQRAAILAANQARHMEDTTAPGQPVTDVDRTIHVEAMKKAVDDVLNGRTAEVEQLLADARFHPDEARAAAQEEVRQAVSEESQRVVQEAMAREARATEAAEVPGFLRTTEQQLALRREEQPEYAPELARALEIAKKPGFQRTAEEKILLDTFLKGRGGELLLKDIPELPRPAAPTPKTGPAPGAGGEAPKTEAKPPGPTPPDPTVAEARQMLAEPPDPIIAEARQRLTENPDLVLADENGKRVHLGDELDAATREVEAAHEDVGLFSTAAQCLIGML
jgi:hypothetical protein